ncbi:hypothetical protein CRUP_037273 [Coryphaenoides rupestris]|nr:hypothetical protein CRUP_037273 [Coryphaenoides rupestris]
MGAESMPELWKKYEHRFPPDVYHEHVLRTADSLLALKVNIGDTTDMQHFRECVFPAGFHIDQAQLSMKARALQGCVQSVLEQEKTGGGLSQEGLRRLLQMLQLTRVMMQACQPYEHLSWHLYNGMALEFLLWASICLELSVTLATPKFLPWKTTLYCAVCQCYYDNGSPVKAELTVMVFKWTVLEARPPAGPADHLLTSRSGSRQGSWRRSPTGRLLAELFEGCGAAHFLALLEALRDGRPLLDTRSLPEEPESQCALLELLSAGLGILSETSGAKGRRDVDIAADDAWGPLLSALPAEPGQLELAVADMFGAVLSEEFVGLLEALHQHVCSSAQNAEIQPGDPKQYSDHHHQLPWCLWTLWEVASACDLASADCLATGEMSLRLALLLEHTAHCNTFRHTRAHGDQTAVVHPASLSILQRPSGELVHTACEVAERGLDALGRGWAALQSQTSSINQTSPGPDKSQGAAMEEAERRTPSPDRPGPGLLSQTALDLNLDLLKALYRASLKRLQLCPEGVSEADLLDRIKKNKVSKALFLTQKALVVYGAPEPNRTDKTKRLLEVCWYQICGRAAISSANLKVRLGDCGLPGTGHLVPIVGGQCELTVEGLEPNQTYVFAVAAYSSQGVLLGNAIGQTTRPTLASIPLPTLSTWALLAQVAFETEQYAVAKRGVRLHVDRLERSSPLLLQWFLASVFIETDIRVQQEALFCDSLSEKGPLIWGQNARLAECERLLLAVDVSRWCGDSSAALQAVVSCYGLLAPLIHHQTVWESVVQTLGMLEVARGVPGDAARQKLLQELYRAQADPGPACPQPSPAQGQYGPSSPLLLTTADPPPQARLWKAFDGDPSQEELASSLGDRGVDLCWLQTLVLDTLGRLHAHGRWESLAHYALLFDCHTR